ncbi:hypothetical protein EDC63_12716 [Sulfurirhabdus autotrophica]|uniref:Uncharacterized protein n=1 Tax=Sulfurirhabdus autotrophica TaxID=1706046 RepID=A0A4R3XSN2_9PROT|nr:hypothetical protein EDC63_12716 [Sulfurirhabdus autotrophica]
MRDFTKFIVEDFTYNKCYDTLQTRSILGMIFI